jgi:hypothetical protein
MNFNTLHVNKINFDIDYSKLSMNSLSSNEHYEEIKEHYKKRFTQKKQKTISFTKDGFFTLMMQLKGSIAVSFGESEAIVTGAKMASKYRDNIVFIKLNHDGTLNTDELNDTFDFLFVSDYVTDTFVAIDLEKIKSKTRGKIISNILTCSNTKHSDILLLDSFKLCGYGGTGVVLYNDELEDQHLSEIDLIALAHCFEAMNKKIIDIDSNCKNKLIKSFKNIFNDDLVFFVNPDICLNNTLHIALKDIKSRELIGTLSLNSIYITNGEGCTLGLLKPSRIVKEMGYSEDKTRWCLSLSFDKNYENEEIEKLVKLIHKKYRQIKALK